MMKFLIGHGIFIGTCVRDSIAGGYIELEKLDISESLQVKINQWLEGYEDAHFSQYKDEKKLFS